MDEHVLNALREAWAQVGYKINAPMVADIHAMQERRGRAAPKCPDCDAGCDRPNCAWDFGASCARHEVYDEWLERLR